MFGSWPMDWYAGRYNSQRADNAGIQLTSGDEMRWELIWVVVIFFFGVSSVARVRQNPRHHFSLTCFGIFTWLFGSSITYIISSTSPVSYCSLSVKIFLVLSSPLLWLSEQIFVFSMLSSVSCFSFWLNVPLTENLWLKISASFGSVFKNKLLSKEFETEMNALFLADNLSWELMQGFDKMSRCAGLSYDHIQKDYLVHFFQVESFLNVIWIFAPLKKESSPPGHNQAICDIQLTVIRNLNRFFCVASCQLTRHHRFISFSNNALELSFGSHFQIFLNILG